MEQIFLIVAFDSSHDAIKAETVCAREDLAVRLIPIPPEVSAGCGLALRAELESAGRVRTILEEAGVRGVFYRLKRDGSKRIVERMEE